MNKHKLELGFAWHQIDLIMLDMDGTLLDLAFDNFFWRDVVIGSWATVQQVSYAQAFLTLTPIFQQQEGTLNWYSLPYWSHILGLDLQALKRQHRDKISLRAGVPDLLKTLQQQGKTLWLVTNAHPQALTIKLEETGLACDFQHIFSSHNYHHAKESVRFWQALQAEHKFTPSRSLMIDDSESVLHAAHEFGLHVCGIAQPDSRLPAQVDFHFPAIQDWTEMTQSLHETDKMLCQESSDVFKRCVNQGYTHECSHNRPPLLRTDPALWSY